MSNDIKIDEIMEAVARGWCQPKTEHKEVDPILAEAISHEIYKLLKEKK